MNSKRRESIINGVSEYCQNRLCDPDLCPFYNLAFSDNLTCIDWAVKHPSDAERILSQNNSK